MVLASLGSLHYARFRKARMCLSLMMNYIILYLHFDKDSSDVLMKACLEGCPGGLIAKMEVPSQTLLLNQYLASLENELAQL